MKPRSSGYFVLDRKPHDPNILRLAWRGPGEFTITDHAQADALCSLMRDALGVPITRQLVARLASGVAEVLGFECDMCVEGLTDDYSIN